MSRAKSFRWVVTVFAATALFLAVGCSAGSEEISAQTSCEEYLKRPGSERHDAAVRISSEIDGVSSPGNPMWGLSLDGACGSDPSMTIGEYFDNGG